LQNPTRRLMAVMFTDIAGFSTRMEQDESGALASLSAQRSALLSQLDRCAGTLVKEMGDGTLSIFPSTAAAVRCARGFQEKLRHADFRVRVGIHWGEVLTDGGDVFGDTVNVASRLEQIAAPGGVCVSGELLGDFPGRRPAARCLGLRKLKGLGRLVEVYDLTGTSAFPLPVSGEEAERGVGGIEKGIPSIAVTMLDNLGDQSDSFYAYGVTADLVSDLTRAGRISVISLRDTMRAMEASSSTLETGKRLNVKYVVGGALWKKAEVFQLSVELYSTRESRLLWSDSWQEQWYNLPAIKGKLADGILKALGLESRAFPGITGTATAGADAYELYLQGLHIYKKRRSESDVENARLKFEGALALDPELVTARVMLGTTYREAGDFDRCRPIYEEAERIAEAKGDEAGRFTAINARGITQWMSSELKQARITFRKALRLARSLNDKDGEARALNNLGLLGNSMGDYRGALVDLEASLAISREISSDSLQARTLCNIGLSNSHLGRPETALEFYDRSFDLLRSMEDLDGQSDVLRLMGIAHNRLGNLEKSLELAERSLRLSRDLGDRPGQCRALNNMGTVLFKLGLMDEAEGNFQEVMDMAVAMGDRVMESIALSNLARIRLEREDFEEAAGLLERSLRICRETADLEGEADALFFLGDATVAMGRPEAAIGYLEGAIDIIDRTGSEAIRPVAQALLARALVDSSPSPANLKRALSLLGQAEKGLDLVSDDQPASLWILARACRRLEAVFLPGDERRARMASRYAESVARGCEKLHESASRISDPAKRSAYLRVGFHQELLKAGEEAGCALKAEAGV